MADPSSLLATAREAAAEGAALALESFRTSLQVEAKATRLDAVTDVDRAVQGHIAETLLAATPAATVVAEEDDAVKTIPSTGLAWVVDPIDGTNNYVAGNRNWGVSVTAVVDGDPVAAVTHMPALDDVYAAADGGVTRNGEPVAVSDRDEPGAFTVNPIFGLAPEDRRGMARVVDVVMSRFGDLRRYGCAQQVLAAVASGELEAAVSLVELHPWDSVGGVHLVRQAGGTVTTVDGEPWSAGDDSLVASNGTAHRAVCDAVRSG